MLLLRSQGQQIRQTRNGHFTRDIGTDSGAGQFNRSFPSQKILILLLQGMKFLDCPSRTFRDYGILVCA